MNTIRLTKEFRFEGAHALTGYDGLCRHIHGHSYRLQVTICGKTNNHPDSPKDGMVIDFGSLKELVTHIIIEPFDHALLLRSDAKLASELQQQYQNVQILPFQPTCEQLCIHFASLLVPAIPKPAELFSIRLYETSSSFVEWLATDNPQKREIDG
ncbi:MAG: 6-carboxytetrahydropterin synthase [Bacteroidales bacterium]|nr:6-carboxytetrahydropterin synthase [Bacteroidales bacterium]